MTTPIRSDPQRAERNLRNAIRVFTPYQVPVYGQDIVDILTALDQARAAATAALDHVNPASPVAMRAAGARILGGLVLAFGCLLANDLHAQPVQVGPTVAVTFHGGLNVSCAGIEVDQWTLVYGERCNPDPPVVLVPFVTSVLVRLTPMTMPPSPPAVDPTRPVVIRTVPRASVYRTADPLACAPTKAPCLSVRVASVPGLQLVDVALGTADGQQTDWVPMGLAVEGRIAAVAPAEGRVRP